ncbi:MAG: (2Fe-2S)-binding protein [Spiroplasma sp.]|nr:(2Fe-2S)-binding protein [Mycoplasmatales bacterium]
MKKKINMIINDTPLTVDDGITIMEAAKQIGVEIPRLCYLKGIHEESNCRVCVVEIEGMAGLNSSCSVKVFEGMNVTTNSKEIKKAVEKNLELVAANHVFECWVCSREHNCELLDLMRTNNVANTLGEDAKFTKRERVINDSSVAIVLDSGKCTLCGRCISACHKQASTHVLDFNNRGVDTIVGPAQLLPMETSGCILCGKCIQACPVAAIKEKDDLEILEDYLDDDDKFVIVQAAPSVRVALGEEFGMDYGFDVEGKMYTAFNELGFDDIADTNFGADLTIMEEGNEFIEKLKDPNAKFPMFTSCSPGWVRYIEQYRQEYLGHLSSAKSPHQMAGAVIKHYYAKKINVDPKKVVNVSVMPCIAKKFESARPEM